MSAVFPFRALRPAPDTAARVASVPYDVVSTDEARALVAGNPLSFLRVTRSEVDLPSGTNPYDSRVYAQAGRNFEELKRAAPLLLEDTPSLYFYRLRMGTHEQIGLTGCFSMDEYDRGLIKKHERTRKDKEDDRTRHIIDLRAQTGIVFLTYRASAGIDVIATRVTDARPLYDFTAPDGIVHAVWRVDGPDVQALVDAFDELPSLYIADGHHRAASAARARDAVRGTDPSTSSGSSRGQSRDEAARFIAVAFPDAQVQILPYNRVVQDLAGYTPERFLAALRSTMGVTEGGPVPVRQGEVGMFLAGRWYTLVLPPAPSSAEGAVPSSVEGPAPSSVEGSDQLDVARLDREVLSPLLNIGDIRTDKRIDFVGGARGTAELERLVTIGKAAVAFSMYPVSIDALMAIADAGGIMPPKSTWFEPKLRDGLLVHLI